MVSDEQCVCVCVCFKVLSVIKCVCVLYDSVCMYVRMYVCMCMCMYACVCACVCVRVCACVCREWNVNRNSACLYYLLFNFHGAHVSSMCMYKPNPFDLDPLTPCPVLSPKESSTEINYSVSVLLPWQPMSINIVQAKVAMLLLSVFNHLMMAGSSDITIFHLQCSRSTRFATTLTFSTSLWR